MDPVSLIVTAVTLGAAAGLKPTAEQAIKDAYAGLKRLITDRYQSAKTGVDLIESNPQSDTFQNTAKELLQTTTASDDEELLLQAQSLIQTVEQYAPETKAEIKLKVEDIEAATNFRIADLAATGDEARIDVAVKKAKAGGDFEISGLKAGSDQDKDPKS